MKQILKIGKLNENKYITVDDKVVSLFYFRAAYVEHDFPDEVKLNKAGILESQRIYRAK